MYVHPRKLKDGTIYYSFSYFNKEGIRTRLKKDQHPYFTIKEEAEAWAKTQDAYKSAQKAIILQKQAWKTQYYDFTALVKRYATWQQEKAPNSYKNNVLYLETYIFDFFLNIKHANNVNQWHLLYQEFFDWIKNEAQSSRKKLLAKNTANNIVKTLNTFTACLVKYNLMDRTCAVKCEAIPEHLMNKRSFQDVISEQEMERVYAKMMSIHPPAAEFFKVLWYTGMRFSELFGLPITAVHNDAIPNKALGEELAQHSIKCLGYLYLESQPFNDDRKRELDSSLRRKPLKGNKVIHKQFARIIPIENKDVWNIMARRFKQGTADLLRGKYTREKSDYVFFENLEWNKAVKTLVQAYTELEIPIKQYHCCRHSFVTHLVGRTRSFFLVRAITGHRKEQSFEKYLHIYEEIALQADSKVQEIEEIA